MAAPFALVLGVAALVLMPIIIGLGYQLRARPTAVTGSKSFKQLSADYERWDRWALLPFFIFSFAIAFVLWWLLSSLSIALNNRFVDSVFLLTPTAAIWALPALFLGIVLSVIPLYFLAIILLGPQRHAEYLEYCRVKHKLDPLAFLRNLAICVVPICLGFSALFMESYVRITEDEFIINEVFSVGERRYIFEQIEAFQLTKSFKALNGNIVRRSFYSAEFKDGYRYAFDHSPSEIDFAGQQAIADYISNRSSATVEVLDPYPPEGS